MGRLFDGPWPIVIIIVVALALFAAPKLPAMARSLGQSMRIIKSEVKELRSDSEVQSGESSVPAGTGESPLAAAAPSADPSARDAGRPG
ncbi:Sec-independent protein translocase subunit TatA [Paenarthrobacter nitroguajacolicus]|uniref:Sec-independent protein translocase subunit TatA n=1 Tax=Paenarthrobacter nitroguajacolicus TaxID=211146 RepID=UPI004053A11C